jgi:hypothetical protein
MQSTFKSERELTIIRRWLIFFMLALVFSGITAIPVEWELSLLTPFFPMDSEIGHWLDLVYRGIRETDNKYPFLLYGYDWLAFAHVVIALAFIGPYKDPVRNKWVMEFGVYACLLIIPFALIGGHFRGIPLGWRIIDCSFGVAGLIPLCICLARVKRLEEFERKESPSY